MDRREFLSRAGSLLGVMGAARFLDQPDTVARASDPTIVTLALCGDVMTGRGIDQVLPRPSDPEIHEPWVKDARRYVELAETANGPIPRAVDPAYIWGDALDELTRFGPDVRIINLETAITRGQDYWPGKGIHYRMHPHNISCLTAAQIDCCALANNHILDWGYPGLAETLETLDQARIRHAGAGRNRDEALRPAILDLADKRRILVLSVGMSSSGIPPGWRATHEDAGIRLLPALTDQAVAGLAAELQPLRRSGDLVVLSIHWGRNWGYEVPPDQQRFARRVIDEAGVDIVHGHSSHHPKGIETYRGRPILYGCGDFVNDYEGIGGHESFRPDLVLLYLVSLDSASGELIRLQMVPFEQYRFRLRRATARDAQWLQGTLARASHPLGSEVTLRDDGSLALG